MNAPTDLNGPAIHRLSVTNFRNLQDQTICPDPAAKLVVLAGANGAGKTNILEAISFFAPGRGLRRARLEEPLRDNQLIHINTQDAPQPPAQPPADAHANLWQGWAVSMEFDGYQGPSQSGIGWQQGQTRQQLRLNGDDVKSRDLTSEHLQILWLTPAMDRLFADAPSVRRRFIDRLIFGFDPPHAGRVAAYEKAQRERMQLLLKGAAHSGPWLDSLEAQMASRAVAIAAARGWLVSQLNGACSAALGSFPAARLAMRGDIDEWLATSPALTVEERISEALRQTRASDHARGSTEIGIHKSDLYVSFLKDNQKIVPAAEASTGEQKALLVSLMLASLNLQQGESGNAPLFLMDEAPAHFDPKRQQELFELLGDLSGQVWLTGASMDYFAGLKSAQYFHVAGGLVSPA